jgi:hypothetical protein
MISSRRITKIHHLRLEDLPQTPKTEWLAIRWQTRVYRALLVHAGAHLNGGKPIQPEQIEMRYWFSDFPNDPAVFPYQADQFKRDWDALTRICRGNNIRFFLPEN